MELRLEYHPESKTINEHHDVSIGEECIGYIMNNPSNKSEEDVFKFYSVSEKCPDDLTAESRPRLINIIKILFNIKDE